MDEDRGTKPSEASRVRKLKNAERNAEYYAGQLRALGWTVTPPAKAGAKKNDKNAPRRSSGARSAS